MEIVTGSTGAVHVTPIDDAVRNGNLGYLNDKVVMTCFRNFEASIITNNQVRVYSGYGMDQGRYFKIDDGEFDNVTIENGSQGYKRADLIVARYTMNTQTGFEDISLAVIRGESGNTYIDPSYSTGNINEGDTSDDMPLYRVRINGLQVEGLDRLFTLVPDGGRLGELETKVNEHLEEFEAINIRTNLASESTAKLTDSSNVRPGIEGVLPANHGGTGGNTLKAGATNLIGALDANGTTPTDNEHYIGTTPSTGGFQRKPLTTLWDYIRSKIRTLLGMSATDIVPITHGGTGKSSIGNGKVLVGNTGGGFDELGIDSAPSSGSNNLITSKGVADALGNAGYGDMMKSTYDPNNDGIIAIGQGGTGANTVAGARNALGLGNTSGALPVANGGTGSADGTLNGVKLATNGTIKGYIDSNGNFKSFRQPTGNATAAQVLSGYTFANADSDLLSGSMPNRGEYQMASDVGQGTDYISFQGIPSGYYPPSTNEWAPEIRAPKTKFGTAATSHVLSGQSFTSQNGFKINGAMANYSGSNRRTVTPSGGTGNEQIALSTGYHDSVIVNRTNPYNAGVNAQKAVTWEESYRIGGSGDMGTFFPVNSISRFKIAGGTGSNAPMGYWMDSAGNPVPVTASGNLSSNTWYNVSEAGRASIGRVIVPKELQIISWPNQYLTVTVTRCANKLR